jgi:hypothetical protein
VLSRANLHDPITRLRAPLVSTGYGNQARDWTAATSTGFYVHWSSASGSSARGSVEVIGDEPHIVTRAKILGGPDLDLEATDRVTGPDGATYEVDGEVMPSYQRGALHHVRAFLRRIDITGA